VVETEPTAEAGPRAVGRTSVVVGGGQLSSPSSISLVVSSVAVDLIVKDILRHEDLQFRGE